MLHKYGLMLLVGLLLAGCQTPLERLTRSEAWRALPTNGGFLYEVSKPATGEQFHLFGTIHLSEKLGGNPAFPLKSTVLLALKHSDQLWVETFESLPSDANQVVGSKDNKSDGNQALKEFSAKGFSAFHRLTEFCYFSTTSVDEYLVYLAMKQKMPVAGLETTAERTKRFTDIPLALREGSKHFQEIKQLMTASVSEFDQLMEKNGGREKICLPLWKLWETWKYQDIDSIKKTAAESSTDVFRQAILSDRSKLFHERIHARLKEGSKPFIAVGAAHLYDKEGLVARFEAEGYTVKWIAE